MTLILDWIEFVYSGSNLAPSSIYTMDCNGYPLDMPLWVKLSVLRWKATRALLANRHDADRVHDITTQLETDRSRMEDTLPKTVTADGCVISNTGDMKWHWWVKQHLPSVGVTRTQLTSSANSEQVWDDATRDYDYRY